MNINNRSRHLERQKKKHSGRIFALLQSPALVGTLVTGSFALLLFYGWFSADLPLLHAILLSLIVLLLVSLLALPLTLCYVVASFICMKKSSSNNLRVSQRYRANEEEEEEEEEGGKVFAMEMSQRLVN